MTDAERYGTARPGGPWGPSHRHAAGRVVLGGCRFSETWTSWTEGMLDVLIDPSSVGLESAQSLVGSIGLDLKLCLKYYSGLPRAAESVVFWGVFQVLERLAPWMVCPRQPWDSRV